MERSVEPARGTLLAVLTLAVLLVSGLVIIQVAQPSKSITLLITGGLMVATAIVVLVRPIIIPWVVLSTRRAWRRLVQPNVRFEPTARPAETDPLPAAMDQAEQAAERAYQVQQVLEAARAPQIRPNRLPELTARR